MDPLGLPKACPARLTVFEVGCSLEALTCASPTRPRSPSGARGRTSSETLKATPVRHRGTEGHRIETSRRSSASVLERPLFRSDTRTKTNKLAVVSTGENSRTPRMGSLRHGGRKPYYETPAPGSKQSSRKASGSMHTPQSAVSLSTMDDCSNKENCGRYLPKSAARVHDVTRCVQYNGGFVNGNGFLKGGDESQSLGCLW